MAAVRVNHKYGSIKRGSLPGDTYLEKELNKNYVVTFPRGLTQVENAHFGSAIKTHTMKIADPTGYVNVTSSPSEYSFREAFVAYRKKWSQPKNRNHELPSMRVSA
jgi:hypothetical protein